MNLMTRLGFLFAGTLLAMGMQACNGDKTTPASSGSEMMLPEAPTQTPTRDPVLPPADDRQTETTEGRTETAPPLWAPEPLSRVRKRLNVDQLGNAIWTATDGLRWTQDNDDDLLETLSLTLGKPDYVEITTENLESNVVFMKFLEDAAGSVCRQMVDRDVDAGTHLLIAPDGEIETHLIHLLEKFHSRVVAANAQDVKQWRWLYDSALTISADTNAAWHTVCVALIRHPDFFTY